MPVHNGRSRKISYEKVFKKQKLNNVISTSRIYIFEVLKY